MKLTITIELGNDAMQSRADASHAIQKALARGGGAAMFEPITEADEGTIMDGNGSSVGKWEVSGSWVYEDDETTGLAGYGDGKGEDGRQQ